MIDPGAMREEIVLQTLTETQSPSGEPQETWPDGDTVWAQWFPAGTKEAYLAQQRLEGTIEGVFRIYFRDDIDPATTRIYWPAKARTFDLKPLIDDGWREHLDLPVVGHA